MERRHLFSLSRGIYFEFRQRYFNCSSKEDSIRRIRSRTSGEEISRKRFPNFHAEAPDPRERPREPVVVDYSRNGGCLRQETATRRCVELEFEPETLDQPLTSIATSTSTFHRVQPHGRRSIRSTASSPGTFFSFFSFFSLNATTLSRTCSRRSR